MTVTAMPKGEEAQAEAKKGKPVKLIAFVLIVVIAAAAGYFLVLAPKKDGGAKPKPVAGAVLPLDSQQINLAAGHYLRLGIALQLTDKAEAEVDGSKALDATIAVFSGLPVEQVTKAGGRDELKKQLLENIEKRYEDQVMDVYFTEFVTQ